MNEKAQSVAERLLALEAAVAALRAAVAALKGEKGEGEASGKRRASGK